MTVSGELEAVIHYIRHDNLVVQQDRLNNHPDVKTLFPDPIMSVRFFRKTSIIRQSHGGAARDRREASLGGAQSARA